MAQVNAFLARSFDPRDEQRIRPILEFLNTFHKAGFICETAEQAEVESVSEKVQRMIDHNDVFIGFFTQRYAVHDFGRRIGDAWNVLFGKLKPAVWSAPAWVLQESGYALRAKGQKKLILLREVGVEGFGLQGDLEYVPFDAENPGAVFPKLSEMINGLLAQAAGIEVKTTVSERRELEQVAAEPSTTGASDAPKTDPEEKHILIHFYEMHIASKECDLQGIDKAWSQGKELIGSDEGGDFDKLSWECCYFRLRFQAGDATSLDQLKRLRTENSARPQPLAALGYCSQNTDAFVEAGGLFLEAAALSEGDDKARRLLNAASAFREAKDYEQAKKAVRQAVEIASKDLQEEVASVQYKVLKDCGEQYLAFAVAESALQGNAQLSLRFDLGLDYYREGRNELGLFHFKFLCRNEKYAAALHNLALLYSESKLPISAIEHYKKAIDLGETLASANLGYLYLDAGMTREAEELVEAARKVEGHDPSVEKCSAAIVERREEEENKELELLQQAADRRKFFVEMGRGLSAATPPLDGRWKFPFGEMQLTLAGDELAGTAEITREVGALGRMAASVLGGSSGGKVARTERYTLTGKLTGAVYKFELVRSSVPPTMLSLSDMAGPKSGFVVFAADGETADYVELADRKFGKVDKLTKVIG